MAKTEIDKMLKEREKLLKRLLSKQGMIRGSLVKTTKKCGRKGCRCEKGEKHPHIYLSISGPNGNTIVYVTAGQEAAFRRGVSSHRKAREIMEKISRLNIAIIKGGQSNG